MLLCFQMIDSLVLKPTLIVTNIMMILNSLSYHYVSFVFLSGSDKLFCFIHLWETHNGTSCEHQVGRKNRGLSWNLATEGSEQICSLDSLLQQSFPHLYAWEINLKGEKIYSGSQFQGG